MTTPHDDSEDLSSQVFEHLMRGGAPLALQGLDDDREIGLVARFTIGAIVGACSKLLTETEHGRDLQGTGSAAQLLHRLGLGPPHAKDSSLIKTMRVQIEQMYERIHNPAIETSDRAARLIDSLQKSPPSACQYKAVIKGSIGTEIIQILSRTETQGSWKQVAELRTPGATLFAMMYDLRRSGNTMSHEEVVRCVWNPQKTDRPSTSDEIPAAAHQAMNDHVYKHLRDVVRRGVVIENVRREGYRLRVDFDVQDRRVDRVEDEQKDG